MKKSTLVLFAGAIVAIFAYRYFLKTKSPEVNGNVQRFKAEKLYDQYLASLTNLESKYGIGVSWPAEDQAYLQNLESQIKQLGYVITGGGLDVATDYDVPPVSPVVNEAGMITESPVVNEAGIIVEKPIDQIYDIAKMPTTAPAPGYEWGWNPAGSGRWEQITSFGMHPFS